MGIIDNYECEQQLSFFTQECCDIATKQTPVKITKPIRLIELFSGIETQYLGFKHLGVPVERHFSCEFDKYCIQVQNALYGGNEEVKDVRNIHGKDLGITDNDKYCSIMSYSYPCVDLSLAGKQKGMSKDEWLMGNSTRSGLLWEVERLLKEIVADKGELPQVLLMENVPQVHSAKNMKDFQLWIDFLDSIGYYSIFADLNAKDYGVPQNRKRTFMWSFLKSEFGENPVYEFPKPIVLERRLLDVLENDVPENFYLKSERAEELLKQLVTNGTILRIIKAQEERHGCDITYIDPNLVETANAISARYDAGVCKHRYERTGVLEVEKVAYDEQNQYVRTDGTVGTLTTDGSSPKHNNRVLEVSQVENPNADFIGSTHGHGTCFAGATFNPHGVSPTLNTMQGGGRQPHIVEVEKVTNMGSKEIITQCPTDNDYEKIRIKNATKDGDIEVPFGAIFDGSYTSSSTRRGRVQKDINVAPTLTAEGTELYRLEICECDKPGTVIVYLPVTDTFYSCRIRKLTERECFRLMAVRDDESTKIMNTVSRSQCYKMAGNAIVCDVLSAMYSQLGIDGIEKWNDRPLNFLDKVLR